MFCSTLCLITSSAAAWKCQTEEGKAFDGSHMHYFHCAHHFLSKPDVLNRTNKPKSLCQPQCCYYYCLSSHQRSFKRPLVCVWIWVPVIMMRLTALLLFWVFILHLMCAVISLSDVYLHDKERKKPATRVILAWFEFIFWIRVYLYI